MKKLALIIVLLFLNVDSYANRICEINDPNADGLFKLIESSHANSENIVEFIKKHSLNFTIVNKQCLSSAEVALLNNKNNIFEAIKTYYLSLNGSERWFLHYIEKNGNKDIFFKYFPLADLSQKEKESLLRVRAQTSRKSLGVLKALLNKGISPNAQNEQHQTALFAAARNSNEKITKLLLRYGADPNIRNRNGTTPLFSAANNTNHKITKLLLDAGADVNIEDYHYKETVLLEAAANPNVKVIQLLLKAGADPNHNTSYGSSPLIHAAQFNSNYEVAKILIDYGADVNRVNNYGSSALSHAVSRKSSTNITRLLLKEGANPFIISQAYDETLLIRAAYVDKTGETVKLLIKSGIDLNAQNRYGNTALMISIFKNSIEVVKLLKKHGANIYLKNNKGQTALDIAKEQNNTEIIKLIEKWTKQLYN